MASFVVAAGLAVAAGHVCAQDAASLFKEGADLLNAGRPAEAVQRFRHGLEVSPNDPTAHVAYFFLGRAYIRMSKWDLAKDALERAVAMDDSGQYGRQARELLLAIPGYTFRDCDVCPEMVVVPPGSFVMGSPADETERGRDEGPTRVVTLQYAMAVGKFEVVFEQWWACVEGGGCTKGNGKRFSPGHPVNEIPWDEAKKYVDWLSEKSGKRYRLLSEAEWEYAARAGTETARYWGNSPDKACQYANVANPATALESWWKKEWDAPHKCDDGYPTTTSPAGNYKPNAFGLYDMLGNVWEWTEDCYVDTYGGAPVDGSAVQRSNCEKRVVRGGGWGGSPRDVRSAYRIGGAPAARVNVLGFRVARTLR
ncbi:MAG: SUMF1/EgtB/PvdO family nonheme iron enzyme [Burkholderiales bacterium]